MARTENTELTVVCLLRCGQQILLQNRTKKDWQGYTLPGGHVEPNESIVEAVIRETREETGLTVLDPVLCGVKQFPTDKGRYLVFLFRADRFTGTLTDSAEGHMEWVDRDCLSHYPTVPDFAELLQVMESDNLSEFRYIPEGNGWRAELR